MFFDWTAPMTFVFLSDDSLGVILIVFFPKFSIELEFSNFFDGNFDSISFSTELYFSLVQIINSHYSFQQMDLI